MAAAGWVEGLIAEGVDEYSDSNLSTLGITDYDLANIAARVLEKLRVTMGHIIIVVLLLLAMGVCAAFIQWVWRQPWSKKKR